MGKNKRRRIDDAKPTKHSRPGAKHVVGRATKSSSNPATPKAKVKPHIQNQHKPSIPFTASDKILLVGEGDFSFAHSLVLHHRNRFNSLCATCYDNREELLEKYPQAEDYIDRILDTSGEYLHESKSEPLMPATQEVGSSQELEDNTPDEASDDEEDSTNRATTSSVPSSVLYSVDATALSKQKFIRTRKWDRIVFNFPHVGGKSTDVNRQVRYNQALLHSFFQAAKPLLSRPHGTALVTIFEGAPYDLWNIRDLARSAGLRVTRSFVFDARLYAGYKHARTLGNIRTKEKSKEDLDEGVDSITGDVATVAEGDDKGEEQVTPSETVRAGKWRGEERKARTYEFGLPERDGRGRSGSKRKRRGKSQDEDSSEEER